MPALHAPLPLRALRALLPATAAGVLLSGCGGGDRPTAEELEAMIVPSGAATSDAANDPDVEELRFNPESLACEPRKNSSAAGSWETSAPRTEVSGDEVELGLRDTEGSGEVPVTVRVLTPGDDSYRAAATLNGSDWAELAFPGDFEAGPSELAAGAHTVVWSVGDGDFVSCDGFQVK